MIANKVFSIFKLKILCFAALILQLSLSLFFLTKDLYIYRSTKMLVFNQNIFITTPLNPFEKHFKESLENISSTLIFDKQNDSFLAQYFVDSFELYFINNQYISKNFLEVFLLICESNNFFRSIDYFSSVITLNGFENIFWFYEDKFYSNFLINEKNITSFIAPNFH